MARKLASLVLLVWMGSFPGGAPPAPLPGDGRLEPTVILVSLDGVRHDYLEWPETPNLRRLAAAGVRAKALIPVYPSKTFPSHYSMVTGLYPGHHGIVSNNIFDPRTGRFFSLSNRREVERAEWWGGEPIWVALEKTGRATATYFWPGSEAEIAGRRPSYWKRFEAGIPHQERLTQVFEWLEKPKEERPVFLTLYFSLVDSIGHRFGPDSAEVRRATGELDQVIGDLEAGLRARKFFEQVNLLIVSDHGMAETSPERVIVLDDYVRPEEYRLVDQGPSLGIFPGTSGVEALHAALRGAHPKLHIYRRSEVPRKLHYSEHPLIPPLVGIVEPGWLVLTRKTLSRSGSVDRGAHGYDNQHASMHGIFVGTGPALKHGVVVEPFENIHLYVLMTAILGLQPAPNDADPAVVEPLLDQ